MREQETGEIVHGEAKLVAVGTDLPLRTAVLGADPGIADKNVEATVLANDGRGELDCRRLRRQVSLIEDRRSMAGLDDLVDQRERPRRIAAMDQKASACRGKTACDIAP